MKEKVRIAIIVPAGPNDDIFDTAHSIVRFTDPSRIILIIDDRGLLRSGDADRLRALSDDVVVIPAASAPPGCFGGLWVKLCGAYRWLLEQYEPGLVLRMDADALMIGAGIEEQAERAFADQPRAGLLGSYRLGPDDGLRDFSWPAGQLRRAIGMRGMGNPACRSLIRKYYGLARKNGYVDGEHVLGGAYIHRYDAIDAIMRNGWLSEAGRLGKSIMGEDHMMSMVTIAAGFCIADFGGSAHPMALAWRGLPAHPSDLLERGKLVTHSVRSWQELTEQEVRAIFAAARRN